MKNTLMLALLVAGFPVLNAQDAPKTFSDGTLPEALRQYDVDGNGVLDEEERQAAKADREAKRADHLARFDTNGDGVIDEAEREAAKAALAERIRKARIARFNALAGEDGVLSLEEFSTIPALATKTAEQIAAMFGHLDGNKDGSVSLEEFLARLTRHRPSPGTTN